MRVLISGGGIGGLALAHGLAMRGFEVLVLERDASMAETGGYKLHLGPPVLRALGDLLPADQLQELLACSVRTSSFTLAVRDHRARLLVRAHETEPGPSCDIDRITLRRILSDGLGDRLQWGMECASYDESAAGVQINLAGGGRVTGDILVIAEGAGSRSAASLAGARTCAPTGMMGIAGRTPTAHLSTMARDLLRDDPMLAFGPGGVGLFASWHAPDVSLDPPNDDAAPPVVIWGLLTVTDDLPRASGEELAALASLQLQRRGWVTSLLELPRAAQPQSVGSFPLLAADPDRIAPWLPRRVTALGDAAHTMPPTGGQGAGTAILDAHHLAVLLTDAAEGGRGVSDALKTAAEGMRRRSSLAVRESLQPIAWIKASATPCGAAATSLALPVAAGLAALVRRLRGQGP